MYPSSSSSLGRLTIVQNESKVGSTILGADDVFIVAIG
jgi:hypothetical protein